MCVRGDDGGGKGYNVSTKVLEYLSAFGSIILQLHKRRLKGAGKLHR